MSKAISLSSSYNRFFSKVFLFFGFAAIVILLGFYVFQVSREIASRYAIEDSEKMLNAIKEENKNLEVNSWQKNSVEDNVTLAQKLNFEKVEKITYIKILDNTVVSK